MNYIKPGNGGEGAWAVLVCNEYVLWESACTHFWKIFALLSLEKFSSCSDSWVRKATAR